MWCLDQYIHFEICVITTSHLVNIFITSHSYLLGCVVRTRKLYSLSKFQVYSIVLSILSIVMLLCIRSSEIHLIIENLLHGCIVNFKQQS